MDLCLFYRHCGHSGPFFFFSFVRGPFLLASFFYLWTPKNIFVKE